MPLPCILGSYFGTSAHLLPDIFKNLLPSRAFTDLKILTIPTAAIPYNGDTPWLTDELNALKSIGLNLTLYDMNGKTEDELRAALDGHDGVYMTGGNTYYLLQEAQKCGFHEVIKDFLARGGFYMGSSAGAALTCPSIDYIEDMDDEDMDDPTAFKNLPSYAGLHLHPFFIMPHANNATYGAIGRNIAEKAKNADKPFVFLSDHQIAVVNENSVELFS